MKLIFALFFMSVFTSTMSFITYEEYLHIKLVATYEIMPYDELLKIFENLVIDTSLDHEKNIFFDDEPEFLATNARKKNKTKKNDPSTSTSNFTLPSSYDLREKYPQCFEELKIKDQGRCGSCFAFGASNYFSLQYCISTSSPKSFAPQDIINCDHKTDGCNGGSVYYALQYIASNGILTEQCRGYLSGTHNTTKYNCTNECDDAQTPFVRYRGNEQTMENFDDSTSEELKNIIFNKGPLLVSGFKVYKDLSPYRSGVYMHVINEDKPRGLHSVVILGWGTEAETQTDYWIAMNSWGEDWGENGFFKIKMKECEIDANLYRMEPLTEDA